MKLLFKKLALFGLGAALLVNECAAMAGAAAVGAVSAVAARGATAATFPNVFSSTIIYINGIQNTLEEAETTRVKIRDALVASPNHQNGTYKKIRAVNAVWNPYGWYGNGWGGAGAAGMLINGSLTQDLAELFLLKTAEEKFSADFQNILVSHSLSQAVSNVASPTYASAVISYAGTLNQAISSVAASNVEFYLNNMLPGTNSVEKVTITTTTAPLTGAGSTATTTTTGLVSTADMFATQMAAKTLATEVERSGGAIVVAHSQGNLLANLAYAKLAATYGSYVDGLIRIVNVANTSAFSVHGLNFTHTGDAALFSGATKPTAPLGDKSLETLATQMSWTRTTPACANNGMCRFTLAAPTFTLPTSPLPSTRSFVDKTIDHSIVETYMSTATVAEAVSGVLQVPFGAGIRFIDRLEDFIYTADDSRARSCDALNAARAINSAVVAAPPINGFSQTCIGVF